MVPDVWVANASPIIVLDKANYLHLLIDVPAELILPAAVANEVLAGPDSDPARRAVEAGWGIRRSPNAIPDDLMEWALGPGETAMIALARAGAMRRRSGRRRGASCAKAFGVPVIGTLGVILRAKNRGIIPTASVVLQAVRVAGLHLEDRIIRLALEGIGETW